MNLTFQVHIAGDNNKEIGKIIRQIAFGIEGEMKILMTGPKSGRAYPRGGGKIHIASKEGEAPAVDTSFLINSIEVPTSMITDTSATVVVAAEYAEILEFEKNRPFVRPAIADVLKRFDSGGFLGGASD
jgi:hypothetical protein